MNRQILKNKTIREALALALCLAMFCGCKPAANNERQSGVDFYFDTVITLTTYGADESVIQEAFAMCAEFELLFSRTIEGSDVWKVNHAEGQPVTVNEHTRVLIEKALHYSALSNGAFDITVAPLMELWDFTGGIQTVPDPLLIEEKARLVGYEQLQLSGNTVTLPSGCQIDFGAIAKGYIADRLADFMRGKGVKSAMINLGGNVYVIGAKPDGSAWNVGLQDPFAGTGNSFAAYAAKELSVVASGTYERGFIKDGTLYHHILEPKTGWPVNNGVTSLTIISPSSADGDALSTACFALGKDAGLALVESLPGIECVYVMTDGEVVCSSGAAQSLTIDEAWKAEHSGA